MIRLNSEVRVYLATTPVDGRKAINGLSAFIIDDLKHPLRVVSVFVFFNRPRDRVKCLFWDKNGFVPLSEALGAR